MRPLPVLLLLVLGCPSSPPPQETTPDPEPEPGIALDGQVLYASPIESAPESIRQAQSTFEGAWASEPPMPPADAGPDEYRTFATQLFAPYVDQQVSAASQLLDLWEGASEPSEKLIHAVLAARLLHRSASWMWTLPLPDVGDVNEQARASLERSIRGAAQNFAQYAAAAFGKCVEAAADTPEFEPWRADCVRRAESIEPIRTAQIGPPPPTSMPEGCEGTSDPMFAAPGHDADARPQLLVLVEAETEGVDVAAVQQAVERWARSEHDLRAVPANRRRAAERLIEAGKTSSRGPVCAAPPSLTWVLGSQVPNLVVAKVDQSCHDATPIDENMQPTGPAETVCDLIISWRRAGSLSDEGLPPLFRRTLPASPTTEAMVATLTADPPRDSAIFGALGGLGGSGARMSVGAIDGDPGYRIRAALEALEINGCQTERGASRLELAWTVTPTGVVESVAVEGGDDTVNTCVKAKLEQLTLTCTPSGDPIPMQTTLCLAN